MLGIASVVLALLSSIGRRDAVAAEPDVRAVEGGDDGWQKSRYPGYLGYVRLGSDTVHLPLEAGANELVLAVTDDQRFGWGFVARLPPGSVTLGDQE